MSSEALAETLHSAADGRFAKMDAENTYQRLHRADYHNAVNQFGAFLTALGVARPLLNEELLGRFRGWMLEQHGSRRNADRYIRTKHSRVRALINSLPEELVRRRLVTAREVKKMKNHSQISDETKRVFDLFLRDGRRLRRNSSYSKPVLATELLSKKNRANIVDQAWRLLCKLGKADMRDVTPNDVENLLLACPDEESRDVVNNFLADIRPLYAYMIAKGLVQSTPLDTIVGKQSRVNYDYVQQEEIDKLHDLSTVYWDDFVDVRDRFIAIGLCYDFALRNQEAGWLEVPDFQIGRYVELLVRKEIQKNGQRDILLCSFFPETLRLLERYLVLRGQLRPETPRLLVTDNGTPLGESGCQGAVIRHCAKLGIKTYEGRPPSPHRFRHSFATLNISKLGLKLDPYEVMRRLRHRSLDTTLKVYVDNNPVLAKESHEAKLMELGHMAAPTGAHGKETSKPSFSEVLSEKDAVSELSNMGVSRAALRGFAEKMSATRKRDGQHLYSGSFIRDIRDSWMTKREAMRMLGLKKSGFFYWVHENGIQQRLIGKVSLVRVEDITRRMRGQKCA